MLERTTTLIFHLGNTTLKLWSWQRLLKKSKERNFLGANWFVGLDNVCKKCMLWTLLLTLPTFVDIQFARHHFQNGLCALVQVQCRISMVHFKLGIVPSQFCPSILWRSQSGNHLQDDFIKFGYKKKWK
jgi:hypothetical protein